MRRCRPSLMPSDESAASGSSLSTALPPVAPAQLYSGLILTGVSLCVCVIVIVCVCACVCVCVRARARVCVRVRALACRRARALVSRVRVESESKRVRACLRGGVQWLRAAASSGRSGSDAPCACREPMRADAGEALPTRLSRRALSTCLRLPLILGSARSRLQLRDHLPPALSQNLT